MLPYCNKRQPNHNLMYTMDHTFTYHRKKFIHVCAKSSAHAHGIKIRGGNMKLWRQPPELQGNGWFTTDWQIHIQTSDGNPRTGTFSAHVLPNFYRSSLYDIAFPASVATQNF